VIIPGLAFEHSPSPLMARSASLEAASFAAAIGVASRTVMVTAKIRQGSQPFKQAVRHVEELSEAFSMGGYFEG